MKKITTMRLDEDLVKKAHDLGLNVTKVCENALIDIINRIEGSKYPNNDTSSSQDADRWGRPDLNRGPERPRLRA